MGLAARLDEYQPRLTRLMLLVAMMRFCLHIVLLHSRDTAWGLQSVCTCVLTGVQHVVLINDDETFWNSCAQLNK